VSYNKEVGEDACYYFDYQNSLSNIIRECDNLKQKEIDDLGKKCKNRIKENYTWEIIEDKYNDVFNELKDN
jgi:rhamnosyltransferase